MVLMAMELLAFHNEFVADFSSDNQDEDFVSFDIIQDTQVRCPQLKLRQRIWTQPLDRFRGRCRLVFQPGEDGRSRIRCSRTGKDRNCLSASSVMVILKGTVTYSVSGGQTHPGSRIPAFSV